MQGKNDLKNRYLMIPVPLDDIIESGVNLGSRNIIMCENSKKRFKVEVFRYETNFCRDWCPGVGRFVYIIR